MPGLVDLSQTLQRGFAQLGVFVVLQSHGFQNIRGQMLVLADGQGDIHQALPGLPALCAVRVLLQIKLILTLGVKKFLAAKGLSGFKQFINGLGGLLLTGGEQEGAGYQRQKQASGRSPCNGAAYKGKGF